YTSSPSGSNENYSGWRGRGGGHAHRGRGQRERTREQLPLIATHYECARDAGGSPISVPMRFEVVKEDGANDRDVEELKDFFQSVFKVAARASDVDVDEMGEVRITPVEGMGHSRWVCHIKATSGDWQNNLSRLAHRFHHLIRHDREWAILRHEMPILFAHSQLIFPLRLINMHKDIPFRRITFGSFINSGAAGIHWNIEGGIKTEADEADGFTFYKEIDASFEYDRRQITIFFHNRECHPDDEKQESFLATYKLTINMSSIRKIGLDQTSFKSGRRRQSLVLHVDYAPKIQVKLMNGGTNGKGKGLDGWRQSSTAAPSPSTSHQGNNSNNEASRWGQFEHRLNIRRGRYPGEVSHRTALHESKILILEFDEGHLSTRLDSSSSLDQLIFDILSRLRHKTGKVVEFTSYDQVEQLEGLCRDYYDRDRYEMVKVKPYDVEDDIDDDVRKSIRDASSKIVARSTERSVANLAYAHRIELKIFRLRALLEGLLQRGMEIRCQLLANREHWHSFVQLVCDRYSSNEQLTLVVMENLLSTVSEGRPHCSVWNLFEKEWKDCRRTSAFTKEDNLKGYTRVMKFVITPTRMIFVGNETIMANRVLKQHSHNGTEIIRVSFRDDSGEAIRKMSCGMRIIYKFMRDVLMERGIHFAGRNFVWLGNSNSQLRDHGIYCFHKTDRKTAREIRKKLGNFHMLTSIPKWLARQGQCFTQARPSENVLTGPEVGVTHDFIGGMTDKGKPYCFSDGVGTISFSLAKNLSDEHSLPRIASAFQIRHKGQKGLLAVDPIIDDRNDLLEMMGKNDEKKRVFVRPSMDKFEVDETSRGDGKREETALEIVKYSMASPLFLNRPLLNILSQVSEDQSAECYNRMMNRIEELLYIQMRNGTQSLYIEHRARETVKEMSFPFLMDVFSDACPLKITSEPFFRSLLRSNLKFVLHKQLAKMQIRIPPDFGRSMFGVVDSTGLLQYGQIFVQYSTSTSKHLSKSRSKRRDGAEGAIIHTGPVLVTKNPCIEKGDVRVFDAIDVPGLIHLVDVVVFPMHGPRPHPDEMAGSDLDGDEYSLIWDPQLLFDHNEEASLFPSGEDVINWPIKKMPNGEVDWDACEKSLAEFYIEAVTQEQIGVLSHAHLATSDYYGLENKASRSLAKKISQSLDFQKNGIAPEEMTTKEMEDPDDPTRVIPPEKAARKPDYMEKMRDAGYESRGIMGKIFREIKRFQHAIDMGEDEIDTIPKDSSFEVEGWMRYEKVAKREFEAYSHDIRTLMEHYGIASEGELLSGQIISIKNRISEKEADDMNLYNTNQVIEEKVKKVIATAREAFFGNIIRWELELDQVVNKRRDVDKDSILSRIVRSSTNNIESLRMKAAAYYQICYDAANSQLENGDQSSLILSFPWVVYDVLADIKLRPDVRIVRVLPEETTEQSNEPLAILLSSFIDDYCETASKAEEYEEFKCRFEEGSIIRRSIEENQGLGRASFVLVEWARHIGGLQDSQFTEEHLVALFLLFGLGEVVVRGTRKRYIQRPTGETRVHLKKGEQLLQFIDYLASREFRRREVLSFGDIADGMLMRGQWRSFGELCIPGYLKLVTTHCFDLPLEKEADTTALRVAAVIKEYEPRKMELPEEVIKGKLDVVRRMLMDVSGCREVQIRPMGNSTEVFISAIGSTENFKLLNAVVISPAPNRNQADEKSFYEAVPDMVYERLVRASEAGSRISFY
ncbi:hypothetical protein PMAYCL1PPCAC_24135, partial [Pristionchus mayeri]